MSPPDVTRLLIAWSEGDESAFHQLIPMVHQELRRIARRQLAREKPGISLPATALVNEAYMRLVNLKQMKWQNRARFFAMSARLVRHVLVDRARSNGYEKRGGGVIKVSVDEALMVPDGLGRDFVALDDALTALEALDPRRCQVVEMRFFGGLSLQETAEALHVSIDTVRRDWRLAKAWLRRELSG
jgi:RNA polymerase sigma factor (TIGR02999 family)